MVTDSELDSDVDEYVARYEMGMEENDVDAETMAGDNDVGDGSEDHPYRVESDVDDTQAIDAMLRLDTDESPVLIDVSRSQSNATNNDSQVEISGTWSLLSLRDSDSANVASLSQSSPAAAASLSGNLSACHYSLTILSLL